MFAARMILAHFSVKVQLATGIIVEVHYGKADEMWIDTETAWPLFGDLRPTDIAKAMGIGRSSVYRAL
jgi:hypothetical protein